MKYKVVCPLLAVVLGTLAGLGSQSPQHFDSLVWAEPNKPVPEVKAVKSPAPKDAPLVELPTLVNIDVGDVELVPVKTNGKELRWTIASNSGIQILPQYPPGGLVPNGLLLIKCKIAGSYDLLAYTALGDVPSNPAVCVITVGTPVPPTPPAPPIPLSPFEQAIWNAYQTDPDPAKVAHAAWAASVYKAAADVLNDPAVVNYGLLLAKITAALHSSTLGMPAGSIKSVLTVIAKDENDTFGTNGAAPIDKEKTKAAFAKYAAALGNLR